MPKPGYKDHLCMCVRACVCACGGGGGGAILKSVCSAEVVTWSASAILSLIFRPFELRLWTSTRALETIKLGMMEGKVKNDSWP